MKRTFQPSVLKRKRTHGFRARMATKAGRAILQTEEKRQKGLICIIVGVAVGLSKA